MNICKVSTNGQVSLPADVLRAVGLRGGDLLRVTIDQGRIILQPVTPWPVGLYGDSDLAMFNDAAAMTDEELAEAAQRWVVLGDAELSG